MNISDWELWACANEMIRQHGEDAGVHATMKADTLDAEGRIDGAAAWRSILRRIDQLQAITGRNLN